MEYPILFNTEMVRAIMSGQKTQTRRPVRQGWLERLKAGNKLYIRETCALDIPDSAMGVNAYIYRADCSDEMAKIYKDEGYIERWYPSIHMPQDAVRLWLEVTDIVRESLSDMSEQDARSEGFHSLADFNQTWRSIYGNDNNMVDVISFHLLNIDLWIDYYNQL